MFFQALLLIGYLLSRAATKHWGMRRYSRIHLGLLLTPFFFLPLTLPPFSPDSGPLWNLLRALTLEVGAPFFVLSMTVVVVQSWWKTSSKRRVDDAYFLYAASNAGAATALIAFPFVIEPLLTLTAQGRLWRVLYAAYAALCASCLPRGVAAAPKKETPGPVPTPRKRALWVLLSAAPCAAMLATTNLMTLDFAAVPLLWSAPLAAYLLTFVLNFKRKPWSLDHLNEVLRPFIAACVVLALAVVGLAFTLSTESTPLQTIARLLDIGKFAYMIFALFALSMIFHKSLASERPESEGQTGEYYSWIAAGGWLGSALVALAVPILGRHVGAVALDWAPVAVVAVAAILLRDWERVAARPAAALGVGALALALAAAVVSAGEHSGTVYSLRNFYGIYTVQDKDGVRWLYHGNTDHGMQFLDPAKQSVPLSYYNPGSPLAEAWSAFGERWKDVAVVGLGAGSIAAYGRKGQTLDFYELDPDVETIARTWFTHLAISPAKINVVTGDARLKLEAAEGAEYDAVILDAFNSGAMPIHLLTKEAFEVYLRRLRPGGVILLHASNRYLDLRPVLAAAALELGLTGASHSQAQFEHFEEGKVPSVWAALSRDPAAIETLVRTKAWAPLDAPPRGFAAWSDQHASLLPALAF